MLVIEVCIGSCSYYVGLNIIHVFIILLSSEQFFNMQ